MGVILNVITPFANLIAKALKEKSKKMQLDVEMSPLPLFGILISSVLDIVAYLIPYLGKGY